MSIRILVNSFIEAIVGVMNKAKLYGWLSAIAGLIGVGMLLGYSLAEGTSSVPVWVGGILIFLASVMLGMTISLKSTASKPVQFAQDKDIKL